MFTKWDNKKMFLFMSMSLHFIIKITTHSHKQRQWDITVRVWDTSTAVAVEHEIFVAHWITTKETKFFKLYFVCHRLMNINRNMAVGGIWTGRKTWGEIEFEIYWQESLDFYDNFIRQGNWTPTCELW